MNPEEGANSHGPTHSVPTGVSSRNGSGSEATFCQTGCGVKAKAPASQAPREELSQDQMSMSLPPSRSVVSPGPSAPGSGPRPESHTRPKLVAELLLNKAGLWHYGRLDLLEDRLLWLVRSERGLAFLSSPEWPPAFLLPQSGEGERERNAAALLSSGLPGVVMRVESNIPNVKGQAPACSPLSRGKANEHEKL